MCWYAVFMPNTHSRRRRDATVELSRVDVGGVYRAFPAADIAIERHITGFFISVEVICAITLHSLLRIDHK